MEISKRILVPQKPKQAAAARVTMQKAKMRRRWRRNKAAVAAGGTQVEAGAVGREPILATRTAAIRTPTPRAS